MSEISRRKLITAGLAATAGVTGIAVTAGFASRNGLIPPDHGGIYGAGHTLTYAAQRLLVGNSNAREFAQSQISKTPHQKGRPPKGDEFLRLKAGGFKDWRLKVDGMVDHPVSFSMDELKSFPRRSQITQMICEEGWSYIAEWTGVPLSHILHLAGVQPQAMYAVYSTMDGRVEAVDMAEARHEQTLVSYGMNGGDIPVGHGGPLRLRVPRQLGYKSRKFLTRLTFTDTLKGLRLDTKYSWYAGI